MTPTLSQHKGIKGVKLDETIRPRNRRRRQSGPGRKAPRPL